MADELVTLTDGTNSVNFLSGQEATTGYVKSNIEGLDPPPLKVTVSSGKPISSSYDDREITITFGIVATDAADLTTKQTKLITILENTRLYWESKGGRGAKAQLQYRRPGGTNTSYIDVFWGECDWGRVDQQQGAAYAYSLKNAQLTLTCEIAFHPSAVVNLETETTVSNCDDATYDNYIDINAADIDGDLPAPCNIKIQPATDFGSDIDKFWIAMVGPKANIVHWGELSYGSSYDASRSAQNKWLKHHASYALWEDIGNAYIELSATEWQAMSGRTWHLLAGVYGSVTSLQWKARVSLRAGPGMFGEIVLQTGDEQNHPEANQWCAVDLGPIYLSRTMAGDYPGDKLFIGLLYNAQGVDTLVQVDFLHLIPEHAYSFKVDKTFGKGANYVYTKTTDNLYIKGAEAFPYLVFTESYTGPESIGVLGVAETGIYPYLMPGEDNRVIFLFAEVGDVHNISRQFKVTIDYLPQYLTPMA